MLNIVIRLPFASSIALLYSFLFFVSILLFGVVFILFSDMGP